MFSSEIRRDQVSGVLAVAVLALANRNWIALRGFWLDPWEYLAFTGNLYYDDQIYKSSRTIWNLWVSWTVGEFGAKYSITISAVGIMLSSAVLIPWAVKHFSRGLRAWTLATLLVLPTFHGSGGWLSPNALCCLLVTLQLGIASHLFIEPKTAIRLLTLVFLAVLSSAIYPMIAIALLGVLISLLTFARRLKIGLFAVGKSLLSGLVLGLFVVSLLRFSLGQPVIQFAEFTKTVEIGSITRSGGFGSEPFGYWPRLAHLAPSCIGAFGYLLKFGLRRRHREDSSQSRLLSAEEFLLRTNLILLVTWLCLSFLGLRLIYWEYLSTGPLVAGVISTGLLAFHGIRPRTNMHQIEDLSIYLFVPAAVALLLSGVLDSGKLLLAFHMTSLTAIGLSLTLLLGVSVRHLANKKGRVVGPWLTLATLFVFLSPCSFSGSQNFNSWNEIAKIDFGRGFPTPSAYRFPSLCDRNLREQEIILEIFELSEKYQLGTLLFEEPSNRTFSVYEPFCSTGIVRLPSITIAPIDTPRSVIAFGTNMPSNPASMTALSMPFASFLKRRRMPSGSAFAS